MIQSMTGYGKSETQWKDKNIRMELRTLNSKNADINVRLPGYMRELEAEFRKRISEQLLRGKIDFSIFVDYNGTTTPTVINTAVVSAYMKQLESLGTATVSERMAMALRLPDTLNSDRETIGEEEKNTLFLALKETLDSVQTYRENEGKVLEGDFLLRIDLIKKQLSNAAQFEPERKEKISSKLKNSLAEAALEWDANRWEQELIYYFEKLDITEEKVRLHNHIAYFTDVLNSEFPNGKKLGFIAQEMGREINTIGSKANHAEMQKCVVQMKDELEKIKEQLLNVL